MSHTSSSSSASVSRFQVRVIRDIVGTTYAVVDTRKPEFANGHSNSLGCWTDLAVAQSIADAENKKVATANAVASVAKAWLDADEDDRYVAGRQPIAIRL